MINRSETEIIQNWQGDAAVPIISICCTTYNHEEYIGDALDGFLMQVTEFSFEVIVRDDASTDNTANIIREYVKKFPNIIKPIYEQENGYQKGIKPLITTVKEANGQYIAICEGDDYWIDPQKLQKQATLLNKNPDIDFCYHKAKICNLLSKQAYENESHINYDGVISANSIIATLDKLMVPTASIMVRTKIINDIRSYMINRPWLSVGDFYFRIFGVANGGALYLNNPMSVYRYFTPGSWTIMYINQQIKKLDHAKSAIRSFAELDRFFNSKFKDSFFIVTNSMIFGILFDQKIYFSHKVKFLFSIIRRIPHYRSIKQMSIMFYIILKPQIKKIVFSFIPATLYKK